MSSKLKIFLGIFGFLVIFMTGLFFGGRDSLFGVAGDAVLKLKNLTRTTIDTEAYAIEADGGNFRAYFFTPPGNPNWRCFVTAGTQNGGPACYPLPAVTTAKPVKR